MPNRIDPLYRYIPELEDTEPTGRPLAVDQVELHSPLFHSDDELERVALGQEVLELGNHGEAVSRMQRALSAAGCTLPRFGADGWFGPETKKALERFQTQAQLPVTGILDAHTLAALDAAGGTKATRYPSMINSSRTVCSTRPSPSATTKTTATSRSARRCSRG
jgi:peptidoglycan hydrolase-like protein with peptidoglycan-binding domain